MDSMVLLASLVTAASVLLVSYGLWSLVAADRNRIAWRVSRTGIGTRQAARRPADVLLQGRPSSIFTPVDRALSKYSWAEKARLEFQKAELHLHLSEFIAMRLIAAGAVFTVFFIVALSTGTLLVGLGGLIAALFIWWQTGSIVRRRIRRRISAVENHLDEALTAIAGSLRAGFSFPQACQMSLNQLLWPLKEEMTAMLEELNVGASLDDSLRNMAERIESYEMDITVNAVLVQRQVGGSLAEILDNVSRTIRERRELRGHLLALTAQQRLSAYFVAGVPIFMAAFLSLISWQFMRPLYLTTVGNILLAIGLGLDMLGFLVMRRLTKIDF
jgi:tight adherence protein B